MGANRPKRFYTGVEVILLLLPISVGSGYISLQFHFEERKLPQTLLFHEVVDAADQLSHDEQEELAKVLNHRLAQANRRRIVEEVLESEKEFAEGRCVPTTPEELMAEILK